MASKPSGLLLPSTQAAGEGKSSVFTYFWAVLFIHDENLEDPFEVFPLSAFEQADFPFKWIFGPLTAQSRADTFSVPRFPDLDVSLFAKIEKGTGSDRRKALVLELNSAYQKLILDKEVKTIKEAYQKIIFDKSHRLLSGYTYSKTPVPLRSRRITDVPSNTDVRVVFYFIIYLSIKSKVQYFQHNETCKEESPDVIEGTVQPFKPPRIIRKVTNNSYKLFVKSVRIFLHFLIFD